MAIHSEKPYLTELSEAQLRQLSDAQAVFMNLADARAAAAAVRGSMRWKRVNGKDYRIARGAPSIWVSRNAAWRQSRPNWLEG